MRRMKFIPLHRGRKGVKDVMIDTDDVSGLLSSMPNPLKYGLGMAISGVMLAYCLIKFAKSI